MIVLTQTEALSSLNLFNKPANSEKNENQNLVYSDVDGGQLDQFGPNQ
jgi:hypothetical protein